MIYSHNSSVFINMHSNSIPVFSLRMPAQVHPDKRFYVHCDVTSYYVHSIVFIVTS